jgi:hypothetical protein
MAEQSNVPTEPQYMYWNIMATLVYVDTATLKGKVPEQKYWPLSVFHRSMSPMCGSELKKVNDKLVIEFMDQYEALHKDVERDTQVIPEVRRMILGTVSFLGVMTHAQWIAGVETQEGPQQPVGTPETTVPGSQQG